jgi:sterol regulatory element-binding transcription factor 2
MAPFFFFSEFSSALEYLKLLHSFVDSVGFVTSPFSSSSVLRSALGEYQPL